MKEFLWVDPQDLLPRDRVLLEENFNSMGSSPAACELWIAAMEVAGSKMICLGCWYANKMREEEEELDPAAHSVDSLHQKQMKKPIGIE